MLYFVSNLFISSVSGFSWFLDWVSRIDVNDSFINSFNFFWTTFLYLPSFFFLMFFIYVFYISLQRTNTFNLVAVSLLIVYNTELMDFLILNTNFHSENINFTSLNLLLTNNLNKYHPFLFYSSVWILFGALFINYSMFFQEACFQENSVVHLLKKKIYNSINFNLLALFLGSWWALQEGTWGGWWNWDPSEVLGLLFTLVSLLAIHSNSSYFNQYLNFLRLLALLVFTIFSYIFIQLNFDLVSHNFGSKFFFFFNHNLFFLEMLFVIMIWTVYFVYSISLHSTNILSLSYPVIYQLKHLITPKWLWILSLYFFVGLLTWISFLPLINYFMWVYIHINSFNITIPTNQVVVSCLLFLILPFSTPYHGALKYMWFGFIVTSQPLGLILTVVLAIKIHWLSIFHNLLAILIFINILTYDTQFMSWYTLNESRDFLLETVVFYTTPPFNVCNNVFIDSILLTQTPQTPLFNTWNTFYNTNSLSLNSFNLVYNSFFYSNLYNLSHSWFTSYLYIETNYINNLLETSIWIILASIVWYIQRNYVQSFDY